MAARNMNRHSSNFKKIAEIMKSYGFQQLAKDAHHFPYAKGY